MKRTMALLLAWGLATAGFGVQSAPLDRAQVASRPAWVMHLDVDALRQTYLGKYLLYQVNKPEMNGNMMAFQSIFSFDLRTQWHGFTAYGASAAEGDAVFLVFADVVPEKLAATLKSIQHATVIAGNHHPIYSWIDKKSEANGDPNPRKYAVIMTNILIIGARADTVVSALNVIEGQGPNFASSQEWPELGMKNSPDFLQGAAHKVDLNDGTVVALLKTASDIKLRASETDEELHAVLSAEAGGETSARQMSIAARGLVALLSLENNSPAGGKVADAITIRQKGSAVTATLSVPSTDFVAALKAYNANKTK